MNTSLISIPGLILPRKSLILPGRFQDFRFRRQPFAPLRTADLFIRGASGDAPTTGSNITFAVDGTSCDALGVWISFNNADAINTCTYAGAACTFKIGITVGAVERLEFWQKIAPATGSNNVDISVVGGTWSSLPSAGASMFNGTDQTTPFINIGTNSGTSTQSTITLTNIGAANSGADGVGSPGTISVPSQTQSFLDNNPARDIGGSHSAGNGSVTYTWTIAPSDPWAAIAVEVKAAGAAGGSPVPPSPSVPSRRMVSWTRRAV